MPDTPMWRNFVSHVAQNVRQWERKGLVPRSVIAHEWSDRGIYIKFDLGGKLPPKRVFPLCGARTRRGTPCAARVYQRPDGTLARRCKNHGGMSQGPTTRQGRAKIGRCNVARRKEQIRPMMEADPLPTPEGMSEELAQRYRSVGRLVFEGRLTREEIGKRLGVTRRTVTRWQAHPLVVATIEACSTAFQEWLKVEQERRFKERADQMFS